MCLLVAVVGVLFLEQWLGWRPVTAMVGAFALAGAVGVGAWGLGSQRTPPPELRDVDERPVEVVDGTYLSSDACQSCHAQEYHSWHSSYHRTMTQLVTPETMAGAFDDVTLTHSGRSWQLRIVGDEYWVTPPEGEDRRVALSTGSHSAQDYWMMSPGDGRDLEALPFEYRIAEGRWIPGKDVFLHPPGTDETHPRGAWNRNCLQCHTTRWDVGLSDTEAGYRTKVVDFGIACEACHGPGGEHIRANRDPRRRYRLHLEEGGDDTITHPGRLDAERSADLCGQCHGIWMYRLDADLYLPGERLDDTRVYIRPRRYDAEGADAMSDLLRAQLVEDADYLANRFWPDGMVRVSGREHSGLMESGCFKGGDLDCIDCHSMHQEAEDSRPAATWANDQLGLDMDGDEACLGCHEAFREDGSAHSHHPVESSGSRCYNCHMPHTTYGLLKAHRSHEIDSPSVDTTLRSGRPDACSLCHLDRPLEWTAEHLETWYEIPAPEVPAERQGVAAGAWWALAGDAGQRALMAWHMGWEPSLEAAGRDWTAIYLAELLDDPYDAVRYIAARSLDERPGYGELFGGIVGYDTDLDAAARRALADTVRDHAVTQMKGTPSHLSALLGANGVLDTPRFEALLAARDQSDVLLKE